MKRATILRFLLSVFLFSIVAAENSNRNRTNIPVGVIIDLDTLVGKMARTSITMAVEDFYEIHPNYSTRLEIYTRDSYNDDVQAVLAALDLVQNMSIEVLIGPQRSSQAVVVSKIGNKSQVPVVSFSATSPTLSSMHVPYFVRTTINDAAQLKAITSVIKAYGWREIVPIYEDTDFGRDIMPFLADALEQINVRIPYRSILPNSPNNNQIQQELYKLQTMQTRVFIVHMSSSGGSTLFLKAKEIGMMSEGYVWIMTNGVTNMVDFFNSSVISAMAGALGVRLYVPNTDKLNDFSTRWKKRFHEDNTRDMYAEPSIYALWAYDAIYALAVAVEKAGMQNHKINNSTTLEALHAFSNGPQLLKAISNTKSEGLTGKFELINGELQFSAFEIINVIGQGIRIVGYWRKEEGLSKKLDENNNKTYSSSQKDLNLVIWPGESFVVPKGWEIPVSGRKLRVGVTGGSFNEFLIVEIDPDTNRTTASGYAVDVFEAALNRLPYSVPYEYKYFGDGYHNNSMTTNDLVYQVYLGNYDVVIGDITIRYNRTLYADFSVPYTDSGVAMIVPVKHSENQNPFVFLLPLDFDLWLGGSIFLLYTGITLWILEPKIRGPLRSSIPGHTGAIVYLSLFAYQEKLESILSKIVAIASVFVLLVLVSSYTASLSSMLTVEKLEPTVTNIHDLIWNGDYVGYRQGSFVEGLLKQIGFEKSKIKGLGPNYAEALEKGSKNGGVAAIVDEIPYIKLFLAKHCNDYKMVSNYKTAGFGFAFPKGSPLVPDVSQAILNLTDGDEILLIEKKWINGGQNCQNDGVSTNSDIRPLKFVSFGRLFGLSGVVCTVSLIIYSIISHHKKQHNNLTDGANDEKNETSSASSPAEGIHLGPSGNVVRGTDEKHNSVLLRDFKARSSTW